MRLIRFMSAAEALLLLKPNLPLLQNSTDHAEAGNATDSVGFCFAIADDDQGAEDAIFAAARRLSGITTMHVCLMADLKTPVPDKFEATFGRYTTGEQPELSTEAYSLREFKRWRMYAPRDIHPLAPIYSGNWQEPTLVSESGGW